MPSTRTIQMRLRTTVPSLPPLDPPPKLEPSSPRHGGSCNGGGDNGSSVDGQSAADSNTLADMMTTLLELQRASAVQQAQQAEMISQLSQLARNVTDLREEVSGLLTEIARLQKPASPMDEVENRGSINENSEVPTQIANGCCTGSEGAQQLQREEEDRSEERMKEGPILEDADPLQQNERGEDSQADQNFEHGNIAEEQANQNCMENNPPKRHSIRASAKLMKNKSLPKKKEPQKTKYTASPGIRKTWMVSFQKLKEYRRQHGNTSVPRGEGKLGNWVKHQRDQYKWWRSGKENSFSRKKIRLLNSIGFVWDPNEEAFDKRLEELKKFKNTYGHCRVTLEKKYDCQDLYWWVRHMRYSHKRSSLSEKKVKRLNSIGFDWGA